MTSKNTSISWSDLAKKIVYAGLGSASMAKSALTDSSFHKEFVSSVLTRLEQRKEEIMEILAREVSKFLAKIDVSKELANALKGLSINLDTTIDFKDKKGKGISPRTTIRSANVRKK